jgi:hypothetical protein
VAADRARASSPVGVGAEGTDASGSGHWQHRCGAQARAKAGAARRLVAWQKPASSRRQRRWASHTESGNVASGLGMCGEDSADGDDDCWGTGRGVGHRVGSKLKNVMTVGARGEE